jgi:hypothetical protein
VLILLSGCAALPHAHSVPPAKAPSAPVATAPAMPVPVPAPARPKRQQTKEAHETREPEKVATIDPRNLIGLQPAAVEKILGSPSAVDKSDPSLVWTYSAAGCSFQIVFYPDLKTESYHALKYTASGEPDSACIRNILTVRTNGPT